MTPTARIFRAVVLSMAASILVFIAVGYLLIALRSAQKGLDKLQVNPQRIAADLDDAWEVLGEAVQTVMRRYGIPEPYEKLKALTRGQAVDRDLLLGFIEQLDIPEDARRQLLEMTPSTYTGLAAKLTHDSNA